MARTIKSRRAGLTQLATAYADAGDELQTFELPEDLAAVADADLAELEDQAVSAFEAIRQGDLDASALEDLEVLAAAVAEIRTERSSRAEAAEAAQARAAELAESVAPAVEEADEAAADDELEVSDEELEAVVAEAEAATETAPEPVAASARRPVDLSAVRRRQPRQVEPAERERVSPIVASADVPGVPAGSRLEGLGGLARALVSRASTSMPNNSSMLPFASIELNLHPQQVARDGDSVKAAIDFATDEHNREAITAAGGPCAQAETLYELCNVEPSNDGLVTLPEIMLSRGRASIYDGYEIQTFLDDVPSFEFTAAEEVAGNYAPGATPADPNVLGPKSCVRVPCDLTPRTVDATGGQGLCVTAGIQQMRSFPEQVESWLEMLLAAYAHKRSQDRIEAMVAGSDNVNFPLVDGASHQILHALEISATHLRTRYRLADSTSVQVWLPYHVKGMVRGDLAKRLGVDLIDVSDERIAAFFRTRKLDVQYVSGWQTAGGFDPSNLGTTTAANVLTAWPTTVDFIMAPFGTWRSFYGMPSINLSVGRNDLATVRNNDEHLIFVEDAELVDRCRTRQSIHGTINVCVDGATAAGQAFACQPVAAPAAP